MNTTFENRMPSQREIDRILREAQIAQSRALAEMVRSLWRVLRGSRHDRHVPPAPSADQAIA